MKDASTHTVYVAINKFLKLDTDGQETNIHFSPRLQQCYLTSGILFIYVSLGMVAGYSSILLPQLEQEGKMNIDNEMSSWIASIATLPTPLGCILGGYLMEVIGRKSVHMMCCVPCLVGWIFIYFSTSTTPLLIGRFTTGICLGILGPASGIYISETSDPNLRGFLLATISFALTLGIVLSHILGTYLSWQNTALVACIFPIICFVVSIPAPESPTFLAKKSKIAEAKRAFYWYRGNGQSAEVELQELLTRQTALTMLPKKSFLDYLKHLKKREFLKPLAIILGFFFTGQWSGYNAITFYNLDIIKQTIGDSIDEYTSLIIMDAIRLIMSVLACYLMKRLSRRALTILSCIGTALSLFALSAYTFGTRYYTNLSEYSILALVALVMYMALITIGLNPMPWTMMGEVFPLAYRGMGSGICALVNYVLIFSVVKTTPWMFTNLGTDGTFLLFGTVCMLGTVALAIFLPETKNKPLHEIEDQFKGEVVEFSKICR